MTEYQDDYLNPSASLAVFSLQCSCVLPLFSLDLTLPGPHFPVYLTRRSRFGPLIEVSRPPDFSSQRPTRAAALRLHHKTIQNDGVGKKCTAPLLAELELGVASHDGLARGGGDSTSVRDSKSRPPHSQLRRKATSICNLASPPADVSCGAAGAIILKRSCLRRSLIAPSAYLRSCHALSSSADSV